ncbi:tetratricopeptide repeat protein [Micromonospora sp. ATCC 39149]|uniref:tetratricopeptide repeat protein n=1 Tax=Micromonospora sp. (strain ATCC 39149 / NRRL 15099 / SCC 1413) TaxID=219305 RepID=UPI00030A4456|nr:tetratricopeptide repeat protein [Micromonospora sp. ATCC 39149]
MTVLPAEALVAPEVVPAPAGLVNLPVRLRLFVGREDALGWLDSAARDPGVVVVQAIHGLGGIGKSTLVARWAATHRDQHRPIWWITADSRAALDAGLVALTVALQPALAALPSPALREWAVRWLACHDGWLLILDNVTDPAHIADLLGRLPHGRILVTSRRATGWPDIVTPLRLDVLEPDQAVALLTGIVSQGGGVIDPAGAAAVCAELGHLPLAVEQAGAYLAQTRTTVGDYLRLLAQHPAAMYRDGEEGRAAERTIARVWHVTLDAFADDPLPGRLLRALAWYAPEAIPRSLWHHLGDGAGEPAVTRAIGRLAAYNMLSIDPATRAVTVHRLVQAVARTPDPDDPHRQPDDITTARTTATAALTTALPDDWRTPTTWPTWRTLLPHVDALVSQTAAHATDSDRVAQAYLLNATSLFLLNQGNLPHAIAYLKQALTDRRRVLGNDHPDTLTSVNNLAYAYDSAGDLGQAIPLYKQALTDRRRVLGNDHPDTLTSVNNLASAYDSAGDLGQAIPLYKQALTDRRRVLGNDHPDTLTSVNNLASAYDSAGDLGQAIPLFEQALTGCRRVLGNDHPQTRVVYGNLRAAIEGFSSE